MWGGQLVLEGDFLQLTNDTPLFAQADFNVSFKVVYKHQQWRSQGDLCRRCVGAHWRCVASQDQSPCMSHEAEAAMSALTGGGGGRPLDPLPRLLLLIGKPSSRLSSA